VDLQERFIDEVVDGLRQSLEERDGEKGSRRIMSECSVSAGNYLLGKVVSNFKR
jgi:hypothetical protein